MTAPRMAAGDISADSRNSWLDHRLHLDLPAEVERSIRQAGLAWENDDEAERHLARAAELAPDHVAVLTARYRFHFYKHHYVKAADAARECMAAVARELGIPTTIGDVTRGDADFASNDPLARFWLWGVQAYGYVLVRLGRTEEGRAALRKVIELDLRDATKTRELLAVIDRGPVGEDVDD